MQNAQISQNTNPYTSLANYSWTSIYALQKIRCDYLSMLKSQNNYI